MIESYAVSLLAGVQARVSSAGSYFRLLDGTAVDITFLSNGSVVGRALGMNAGFFARAKDGESFDAVELVSATAQNTKFLLGSAEVGAANAVSVSGDVSTIVKSGVTYAKSVYTAGITSVLLRGSPPTPRRYFFMQNVGVTTIFVIPIGVAALNTGIKLKPDDSYTWDAWVPNESLYAISDAAGGLLSWIEGT